MKLNAFVKQRALFRIQKNKEFSKSHQHFEQKKRALPQFSEISLIETRPLHFLEH